jgi:benzoate transport
MMDPQELVRNGPMSQFQILVVGLAVLIAGLDGFDVLAAAYTAPAIASAWHLRPTEIGALLSTGLVGMGFGALIFGMIGDRLGRRSAILLCLIILCVGMFGSATSDSLLSLGIWRVFTGLGIGGVLANINILVAEFSPARYRHLTVVIMSVGYPIGATLGGFASVPLIKLHGWPAVYIFGGIGVLILLPIALFSIPESIDFLLISRSANALQRLNRIMARMGYAQLGILPEVPCETAHKGRLLSLFQRRYRGGTISTSVAYFCIMMTAYFLLSWMPKVITSFGFDISTGIAASLLLNTGGVAGCVLYGLFASAIGARRLAVGFLFGLCIMTFAFGYLPAEASVLLIAATVLGFCLHTSISCLYAVVPFTFPAAIRTTGTGFAMSIGRVGAVGGPLAAGFLMSSGWPNHALFAVLSLPALVAVFSLYWIRDNRSMQESESSPDAVVAPRLHASADSAI